MESITLDALIAQTRTARRRGGNMTMRGGNFTNMRQHRNKPFFHRNWPSGMLKRSGTNTGTALCHHGSTNYFAGRSYCSSNAVRRGTSVGGPYRHTTHPS